VAVVSMWCPNCRQALYFDSSLSGTSQRCAHCSHGITVPAPVTTTEPAQAILAQMPVHAAAPAAPSYQERFGESSSSRRLNMGSGCFAMLAVMFASGLMVGGLGKILDADPQKAWAYGFIVAGFFGLIAFVFFGYIATESAKTERGREHR